MSLASTIAQLVARGFPESTARKIATGELPMDEASRMARARDQGYDVGTKRYRGISEDYSVDGANIPTTWTSENPTMASEYAMGYRGSAPNVMPVVTKSENTLNLGIRASEVELKPEDVADRVGNRLYERLIADEISEEDYKKGVEAIWNWEESLPQVRREVSVPVYQLWNKDKGFVNALKEAGFDSIEDYEYTSMAHGWGGKPDAKNLGLLDESQVRSTSAAFDPDEVNNPNLMASPAPAGAVGGLLATEAMTPEGQLNPLLAIPAEVGSALNEAIVGTLDFIGPDTINAVSELAGSEFRVPRLSDQELIRRYTQGGYMQQGAPRNVVRTATGLLSPL